MQIVIQKNKADAFVAAMNKLGEKFNNKYINGKLEDFVNLTMIDGKLDLIFNGDVPEMVRIASYLCFVDTLL